MRKDIYTTGSPLGDGSDRLSELAPAFYRELMERVSEVAHSIEERVRRVTGADALAPGENPARPASTPSDTPGG
jgi:hypothetical protein